MKKLIVILFAFISFQASAQTLKREHQIVDSLNKKYKVYNNNIIGYSKTFLEDRETLILFYIDKGELKEMIAWSRLIPKK